MAAYQLFLFLCLYLMHQNYSAPFGTDRNKLIYIMIDGFRYDYVQQQPKENLPGFNRLLENGVHAEYMTPIFPTLSYPDWTTLVTGLYPESHGIVGNYIHDADDNVDFGIFDSNITGLKKWWTAEPIWTTATKGNVRTAVFLWSRCDIDFDGVTPEYCEPFVKIRGFEIFKTNMEKALDKLEQGFEFIQVYNEHTDNIGHDIGPETDDLKQALRDLDPTIVYMLDRIEQMGMSDEVNIILVSDHGMTSTAPGEINRVQMDDYLLTVTDHVESIADAGAYSNIKVKTGYVDQVYEKLSEMPGVKVYKHDDIPEEFHIKNNKNVYDIILKAELGTFIMKSRSPAMLPTRDDSYVYYGAHGYDPSEEKMRAIFFAAGPDFKRNATIPPIKSVDVYPLLTFLLRVDPEPNNGTLESTKMALVANDAPTTANDAPTTVHPTPDSPTGARINGGSTHSTMGVLTLVFAVVNFVFKLA